MADPEPKDPGAALVTRKELVDELQAVVDKVGSAVAAQGELNTQFVGEVGALKLVLSTTLAALAKVDALNLAELEASALGLVPVENESEAFTLVRSKISALLTGDAPPLGRLWH